MVRLNLLCMAKQRSYWLYRDQDLSRNREMFGEMGRFEFAPSGYRSAALPVQLSSPQGLEASFIQFKCARDPAGVNIFQLTSAVSDYHEKFLFMYISEDNSEIELKHCTSSHG